MATSDQIIRHGPTAGLRGRALLLALVVLLTMPAVGVQVSAAGYAEDAFGRVTTSGWGGADIGGTYTHFGPFADYAVDGSAGAMTTPVANVSRGSTLESVSVANVSVKARVRTSKVPTGSGQYAYLVARRHLGSNSEYRAQLRFTAGGGVHLAAARVTNGSSALVGTWVTVGGISHSANTWFWMRAEFDGTSPTTIRSRVWPMSQPEPTTWQFTTTDSTAALQTGGGVGLRAYLGTNVTNAPVVFGFDDLLVTPPGGGSGLPPDAEFNHAQQPASLTVRFADTSTGGATSWTWNFGDGGSATVQNATHTYSAPGDYTVSLVAGNAAGSTSEQRTISVAPAGVPPDTPINLAATPGEGQITLEWDQRGGSGIVGYNIYRDGAPPAAAVQFTGAGDIAGCDTTGDEATAALLDDLPGWVYTTGDNVYEDGTTQQFRECYHPSWGRQWARTFPVIGNHEYHTTGASGYFGYFGGSAGAASDGYYAVKLGSWLVIVLNSECGNVGGCFAGSAQEQWLRSVLADNTHSCTAALWHQPLFTSGTSHSPSTSMRPLFKALYDFNADLVLVGHVHNYERFAAQTELGVADPVRGIRQFVVGTGGRSVHTFGTPTNNSERRGITFGVLQLTLDESSYAWQFVPVDGATFSDSGTTACHDSNGPISTGTRLNATLVTGGTFVDATAVRGTEHRYVVTSVDAAGNESIPTAPVWATASGLPPAPVANFSHSQQPETVTVNFSDTSTGTPTGWSWNFGDGTSSTQQHPTKTYAAAGDYQVTLTASNAGGSDGVTKTVSVAPPPAFVTYAADTFARTVSNGWGTANTGGTYTLDGTAANFGVGSGVGNLTLPATGASRAALLNAVSARDVELLFRVRSSKVAVGGAQYVYGEVRRSGINAYRPKLILNTNGTVAVHAGVVISGAESSIAPPVTVAGLTHTASGWIWLRAQVSGSSPTTIRIRAWADGQPEPSVWHFQATNSASAVQAAGTFGLRAYMSSTNAPVTFSFDDYRVTSVQ